MYKFLEPVNMLCHGKKDFEDDDHITDLGMMSELSKGF